MDSKSVGCLLSQLVNSVVEQNFRVTFSTFFKASKL